MRCIYCLNELEPYRVGPGVQACKQCGLQYADDLLADTDLERILTDPRYAIERIDGNPPQVIVHTRSEAAHDGPAAS